MINVSFGIAVLIYVWLMLVLVWLFRFIYDKCSFIVVFFSVVVIDFTRFSGVS